MRLLKRGLHDEASLTKDLVDGIPAYAILSHTWGQDEDEVTFDDLEKRRGKEKLGYAKIRFCETRAGEDDLQHFWVDTCCINKDSHTELSEAITSMFRWYQQADRCYVFLSDVSVDSDNGELAPYLWEGSFRRSRWFTRGWTLQELLAPTSVEFFSREGRYLGSKQTLEELIHEITTIPIPALQGKPLTQFSVKERLRWITGRNTKKPEDQAYCLLGIFDIFMPLIYGEKENAIQRLKAEIRKQAVENIHHGLDVSFFHQTPSAVSVSDCILQEGSLLCAHPTSQQPAHNPPAQHTSGLVDGHLRTSRSTQKRGSHVLRMLKTSDYEGTKSNSTRRFDGTCEWFVQNLDYQRWRQKTTKCLLWYSADPGCGKTVLARYLVDEVHGASPLTLYFFFQRRHRQHSTLSTALCAILHQLYSHRPHLLQYAEEAYKELGRRLVSEPISLWRLFEQSVANSCDGEILCVLDALDECDMEESKILFKLLLEEHHSSCNGTGSIKFLITSRPYYYVQQFFRDVDTLLPVFRISGEAESKSISQDVEIFIRTQVSRLDLEPEERFEVENKLLQKQNHDQTFLWAFLITEQLRAKPPSTHKKLLAAIDQLPPTVLEAYEAILRDCTEIRNARKILSIVVAARQPLTLDQIDMILALEPQVRQLEDLDLEGLKRLAQTIRHTCSLFVRVADSKIYLIHQTAQDFLLCKQVNISSNLPIRHKRLLWQRSIVMTQSHFELASVCIKFLNLKDLVCRSSSRHSSAKNLLVTSMANNTGLDFSNIVSSKYLIQVKAFAAYAKANWTFHVVEMVRCVRAHHQVLSIERLLGLGLDLQMLDADGKSVLHRAVDIHIAQIDMELVQCILRHGRLVDRADHDNMTCMHYTVLRCN